MFFPLLRESIKRPIRICYEDYALLFIMYFSFFILVLFQRKTFTYLIESDQSHLQMLAESPFDIGLLDVE